MMRLKIVFVVNFFALLSLAQTTISVQESDYKNEKLLFYAYADYISFLEDTVLIVATNQNGAFSVNINIASTRQIFIDLGVYHCSFYVEPNINKYDLELPEKRIKTKAEELNIYFEPISIRLTIKNSPAQDLNKLIYSFDRIYEDFITQNFDSLYRYPQSKLVDTFEKYIDNFYSEIHHNYFDIYRFYRVSELRFLGPNRSVETITSKFYNNKDIYYYNPAYMQLFNLLYKDFFNYYLLRAEGHSLLNVVKEGRSVKKLITTLEKSNALSDTVFEELLILKGIHDELFNPRMQYQTRFPKPQMNIVLDSLANFSLLPEHRLIASNILKKAINNPKMIGKQVPSFKFTAIDGSKKSLDDFKGKYIYLNFMRTDVVPAMESMDRMINFYKSHNKDIDIVSIFTDEDSSGFSKLDTIKYKWNLCYLENKKEMLDFFKVITWPQFYLIDPEGKIIMSPAPSIKEHFEIKFFNRIESRKEN